MGQGEQMASNPTDRKGQSTGDQVCRLYGEQPALGEGSVPFPWGDIFLPSKLTLPVRVGDVTLTSNMGHCGCAVAVCFGRVVDALLLETPLKHSAASSFLKIAWKVEDFLKVHIP